MFTILLRRKVLRFPATVILQIFILIKSDRVFLTEFYREFFVSVMSRRPAPKSLEMEYQAKKLKLTPLEHSKTHSPDEIHPTHRQDIGKVS